MERRLVKLKVIEIDGRKVFLNFREAADAPLVCRYSVEIQFSQSDRAVLDGPSLSWVEAAVDACLQATIASRRLLTNVSPLGVR